MTSPPTASLVSAVEARPLSEWTEEDGNVLWWRFPIEEAPYVGSPLDLGHQFEVAIRRHGEGEEVGSYFVGGWPGYHTHWTPIPLPAEPSHTPVSSDTPAHPAPSEIEGGRP